MTSEIALPDRPLRPDRALRRHAFLIKELVRRDFRGRYAGSVFGFLWSFAQPLWLIVLFTFVFSTVLKVSLVGERTGSFGIFLFSGFLPWMAIQEGLLRGATAITESSEMVKKVRFPASALVVAAVLSALVHQLIALAVFGVILAALGELSPAALPLLLPAFALQLTLTLGGALGLAALNVIFRDVVQALNMVLNAWFYLTPIVYPLDLVPAMLRPWIELNPLTVLVELYRQALLGNAPDVPVAAPSLAVLLVTVAVVGSTGWWLFRRLERTFADEL